MNKSILVMLCVLSLLVAFRLASWPPPLALTIGESVDAPLSSRPERALLAGKAAGNTMGRALTRGKHCGSAEGLSEPPTGNGCNRFISGGASTYIDFL